MQQIKLPKIDKIANNTEFAEAFKPEILHIAKNVINEARRRLINGEKIDENQILQEIKYSYEKFQNMELKSIINATGVVLHTNLGRSVISDEILTRAKGAICSYSNLEFDILKGVRANRYDYVGTLLAKLFGAEDALVVNNNASAVFLVLNTFGAGRETVVSRGELVEIGGNFRVSEVMASSGTKLVEIGTTNKTKFDDYKEAINENTAILMKVHRSNFKIQGFSQSVEISKLTELATLANEKKAKFLNEENLVNSKFQFAPKDENSEIIDYYDLGSASVGKLGYNLGMHEPNVAEILRSGARIVSFSGDKLFGATQCGIILAKRSLIAKLRKNQLLRMLRTDKITLAILCETIKAYMNKEFHLITTINQIHLPLSELDKRAKAVQNALKGRKIDSQIIQTSTFVGGGTLPCESYESVALWLKEPCTPRLTAEKFRAYGVVGRIENDKFLLDFRSILEKDIEKLIKILKEMYE